MAKESHQLIEHQSFDRKSQNSPYVKVITFLDCISYSGKMMQVTFRKTPLKKFIAEERLKIWAYSFHESTAN